MCERPEMDTEKAIAHVREAAVGIHLVIDEFTLAYGLIPRQLWMSIMLDLFFDLGQISREMSRAIKLLEDNK